MSGGRAAMKFLICSSSSLSKKSAMLSQVHGKGLFVGLHRASTCRSPYCRAAYVSSRSTTNDSVKRKKRNKKEKSFLSAESLVKRTRSNKELDEDVIEQHLSVDSHIPVMVGEVLDVFSSSSNRQLHSFVDCTVGAGGHSSTVSNLLFSV